MAEIPPKFELIFPDGGDYVQTTARGIIPIDQISQLGSDWDGAGEWDLLSLGVEDDNGKTE